MIRCRLCHKEFKANSGLASHMFAVHHQNRDGSPITQDQLNRVNGARTEGQTKGFASISQRVSSGLANKLAKDQAAGVVYTCPECGKYKHKKVTFATPLELGKHRRFVHGVQGSSSTAKKSRERTLANNGTSKQVIPTDPAPAAQLSAPAPPEAPKEFQCPHCPRSFHSKQALAIHVGTKHRKAKTALTTTPVETEITENGVSYGKENGITHQPNGKDIAHATAEALIVAHAAGVIKGTINAIAERYDFPARQLAIRCAQSILSEAKR